MKIILTEEQFKRIILKEKLFPNEDRYKYIGKGDDPDSWDDENKVRYDYDVIATVEDNRDGKKYDVVRYYFDIRDVTYHDDKGKGLKRFQNRKNLLLQKLKREGGIPFRPSMLKNFTVIKDRISVLSLDSYIKSDEYKKEKEVDKKFWRSGWTNKLMIEKDVKFNVTYLVPSGFHFNVGYLYR